MQLFDVRFDGKQFLIEGITDASIIVTINSKRAFRLAHVAKHKADLEFTSSLLSQIEYIDESNGVALRAFWEYAIVNYVKCFTGGSVRSQLDISHILKNEPDGVVAHNYFLNMRNKNLIYDENSLSQSIPAAALNNGDKTYKIEKIVVLSIDAMTFTPENFCNLSLLVGKALDWAMHKFDKLCNEITLEVERLSYEELTSMPSLTYTVPGVEDIDKRRSSP